MDSYEYALNHLRTVATISVNKVGKKKIRKDPVKLFEYGSTYKYITEKLSSICGELYSFVMADDVKSIEMLDEKNFEPKIFYSIIFENIPIYNSIKCLKYLHKKYNLTLFNIREEYGIILYEAICNNSMDILKYICGNFKLTQRDYLEWNELYQPFDATLCLANLEIFTYLMNHFKITYEKVKQFHDEIDKNVEDINILFYARNNKYLKNICDHFGLNNLMYNNELINITNFNNIKYFCEKFELKKDDINVRDNCILNNLIEKNEIEVIQYLCDKYELYHPDIIHLTLLKNKQNIMKYFFNKYNIDIEDYKEIHKIIIISTIMKYCNNIEFYCNYFMLTLVYIKTEYMGYIIYELLKDCSSIKSIKYLYNKYNIDFIKFKHKSKKILFYYITSNNIEDIKFLFKIFNINYIDDTKYIMELVTRSMLNNDIPLSKYLCDIFKISKKDIMYDDFYIMRIAEQYKLKEIIKFIKKYYNII